jgi:putative endonuclease
MRRYFVYILTNRRHGVLYVGLTNDLHRRMFQHRSKAVPGFTRAHGIIGLVYFEEYASITEARAHERTLKRWRRDWKLALVDETNPEWRDLAEDHFMLV